MRQYILAIFLHYVRWPPQQPERQRRYKLRGMASPLLRPATLEDAPALREIYNHAVTHTTASYDLEPVSLEERQGWLRARQAAGWPVVVAELEGEVTGYGSYGTFREKPAYRLSAEHSLYVSPTQQGRGVGSLLLSWLIEDPVRAAYTP